MTCVGPRGTPGSVAKNTMPYAVHSLPLVSVDIYKYEQFSPVMPGLSIHEAKVLVTVCPAVQNFDLLCCLSLYGACLYMHVAIQNGVVH